MNEIQSDQPLDNVIDRIVDGLLSPGQLGLALARIDREGDGWKRCTLAFLEAQCWRDAFRALDAPGDSRPSLEFDSIHSKPARWDRSPLRWCRSAAAAAIVAASFVLGWLSHVPRARELTGPVLPVAAKPVVAGKPHDSPSEASIPASARRPLPAGSGPRFAAGESLPDRGEGVQTVAQLRIGPEGAGATVPILAGPGIDGDWLKAQPPPVSEHEQVVLQRLGYQVDQRRRVLIATLADGRRVSVPIDQVQIRYTGTNPL